MSKALWEFSSNFHSAKTADKARTTATEIGFSLGFKAEKCLKTGIGGPFGVPVEP